MVHEKEGTPHWPRSLPGEAHLRGSYSHLEGTVCAKISHAPLNEHAACFIAAAVVLHPHHMGSTTPLPKHYQCACKLPAQAVALRCSTACTFFASPSPGHLTSYIRPTITGICMVVGKKDSFQRNKSGARIARRWQGMGTQWRCRTSPVSWPLARKALFHDCCTGSITSVPAA